MEGGKEQQMGKVSTTVRQKYYSSFLLCREPLPGTNGFGNHDVYGNGIKESVSIGGMTTDVKPNFKKQQKEHKASCKKCFTKSGPQLFKKTSLLKSDHGGFNLGVQFGDRPKNKKNTTKGSASKYLFG